MKLRVIPVITTALLVFTIVFLLIIILNNHNYSLHNELLKTATIKPVKVFQIGFSKCGTSSLAYFFNKNGVPSVHHNSADLPLTIYNNHLHGRRLLDFKYQKYSVFTDMEVLYRDPQIMIGPMLFKELDKQYPGSKFILNTRNKNAWLKSRALQPIKPGNVPLLEVSSKILKITPAENLQRWSAEWDEHHKAVKEYFKDRPNDLLVFDIENDAPQKLCDFFKDHFVLDPRHYTKKNDTALRWLRERFTFSSAKLTGEFLSMTTMQ